MKNRKSALSIVEVMIVLLIIVTGLVGVYVVYIKSIRVTTNLENKIQAIQMAREGIEAMINIRDTNWISFPLDKENCWLTKNYDTKCFGNNTTSSLIQSGESYRILRDNDGRWFLESPKDLSIAILDKSYLNPDYRSFFQLKIDSEDLYTQGTGSSLPQGFTRELQIGNYDYEKDKNGIIIMKNGKAIISQVEIKSIVRWADASSTAPNEVILETQLANYKR